MFAAVKISTLSARRPFVTPKPQISFYPVKYKGRPLYYLVDFKCPKGKINWDLLLKYCSSYKSRLLLPSDITLPDSIKLRPYNSNKAELILIYNTMLEHIKSSTPCFSFSLCLSDKDAIIKEKILTALPYFSKINIITDKPHMYKAVSDSIMKAHGLCLTFSKRPIFTDGNSFLVTTDPEIVPLSFKGTVFCTQSVCAPDCTAVRGKHICLTDELSTVIPKGIDPVQFLSAAYEFSDGDILSDIYLTS